MKENKKDARRRIRLHMNIFGRLEEKKIKNTLKLKHFAKRKKT